MALVMQIAGSSCYVPRPIATTLSRPRNVTAHSSSFLPGLHSSYRAPLFGDCVSLRAKQSTLSRPKKSLKVMALFGLGMPEIVVIAGVAALVFGPKKLPEIGKSLGKTVKSFQQAANEFQAEITTPRPESETAEVNPESPKFTEKEKENVEVK